MKMNKLFSLILIVLACSAAAAGCTGRFLSTADTVDTSDTAQAGQLALVRAQPQDTLESLALHYLGDRDKAWRIAEFNQIQTVQAGQRVLIPLKPVVYGGLHVDGYQTVPVLFYSRVAEGDKVTRGVSAAHFEHQIRLLGENGYRSVSLDALNGFLNLEAPIPSRSIVITFDSAQRWVYDIAYPILKKYGFQAAVFIPTGLIGKPGNMRWSELAAMAAEGVDIGTSGVLAGNLLAIYRDDPAGYLKALEEEVAGSREAIRAQLKRPCHYFAYPAGRSNDLMVATLKGNGYKAAFTYQSGSNPFFIDNYRVRRFVIDSPIDDAQFRKTLTSFVSAELR